MVQEQLFSFFIYIIVGILIGFIYDIFRAFRKTIKNSNLATNIEDILFVVIAFLIIVSVIQIISKGELRLYILLGMVIGLLMYFLIISKYIIKVETIILKFVIKIFKNIYNLFMKIARSVKKLTLNFFNMNARSKSKLNRKTKNI